MFKHIFPKFLRGCLSVTHGNDVVIVQDGVRTVGVRRASSRVHSLHDRYKRLESRLRTENGLVTDAVAPVNTNSKVPGRGAREIERYEPDTPSFQATPSPSTMLKSNPVSSTTTHNTAPCAPDSPSTVSDSAPAASSLKYATPTPSYTSSQVERPVASSPIPPAASISDASSPPGPSTTVLPSVPHAAPEVFASYTDGETATPAPKTTTTAADGEAMVEEIDAAPDAEVVAVSKMTEAAKAAIEVPCTDFKRLARMTRADLDAQIDLHRADETRCKEQGMTLDVLTPAKSSLTRKADKLASLKDAVARYKARH
ncbi:hypothetical protein FISHEDRAFT_54984 [Fistulina hepatica ATCC 64428]|uniref:Enkurin domain-containing protein n=1 Tax=Fistulina hepatica ATCC 64428 TaxID=1128425 RepID=A0A0D7ASG4_9AGAR|nr:hypothetical protein FISHEDRAFT_54984 [Fistulina hepatica ATCC 64428]